LMAATIIVYAGAIVVTFLFVLMLAQQTGPSDGDQRSREPLLASITGFVLLGALLYVLRIGMVEPGNEIAGDLRPFLDRIHGCRGMESAESVQSALNDNPEARVAATERQWQKNNPRDRLKERWDDEHERQVNSFRDDKFFDKLKKYVVTT